MAYQYAGCPGNQGDGTRRLRRSRTAALGCVISGLSMSCACSMRKIDDTNLLPPVRNLEILR